MDVHVQSHQPIPKEGPIMVVWSTLNVSFHKNNATLMIDVIAAVENLSLQIRIRCRISNYSEISIGEET